MVDTSIEMKSLKSDQTKKTNNIKKVSKLSNFKIAMSCLISAVGILMLLIYLVVANFGTYQEDKNYNVLVLGGVDAEGMNMITLSSIITHIGSAGRPDLSLDLINFGNCPPSTPDDYNSTFPSLPTSMTKITASFLTDLVSIEVCEVKSSDSLSYCWRLRNGTSWWEKVDSHVQYNYYYDDDYDDYNDDYNDNDEHQPCSHRHGAATAVVGHQQFLFGGKRYKNEKCKITYLQLFFFSCDGEFPTKIMRLDSQQHRWISTNFSLKSGRVSPQLINIPCDFKFNIKKRFSKLLELS